MTLENKLRIIDSVELSKAEEKISKKKAIELFDKNVFDKLKHGSCEALFTIHKFLEGNGRSMRIWLDLTLKKEIGKAIDWSMVDKEDYVMAMERSTVKDIEIKHIIREALIEDINDREIYMKGIDHSYYYEGYAEFKAEEL